VRVALRQHAARKSRSRFANFGTIAMVLVTLGTSTAAQGIYRMIRPPTLPPGFPAPPSNLRLHVEMAVVGGLILAAGLTLAIRRIRRQREAESHLIGEPCEQCGYDTGGLGVGTRCPECGSPIRERTP
jgi:hypothetical protein